MDLTQRFLGYAAACEVAYQTDDWSHLDPSEREKSVLQTAAAIGFKFSEPLQVGRLGQELGS